MDPSEQQLLTLAALLHNIGKFAQRAEAPGSAHLAGDLCPGGTSHTHVLCTHHFIEKELPLPPELEGSRGRLARLASAFRLPDRESLSEQILAEADLLASGNDLLTDESAGEESARLESVFAQVHLQKHPLGGKAPRYRLAPLDGEGNPVFPVNEKEARVGSCREHYAAFLKALRKIPTDMGARHYLSSLATVLERFTWCVPVTSRSGRADVSLFDHSWTSAAIAQALARGGRDAADLGKTPLLLFGGELSGIQKFIFGEGEQGDRGASKLLRARSFSLQMLTRSIWLVLLERCGLSAAARIMDAGGRFILLLPDTPEVRQTVDKVSREAMLQVLERFNGILRVSFARQELLAEDLAMASFQAVFSRLNDRLERAKLQPFAPLLADGFSPVIGIRSEDFAQYGPCPYCDLRPSRGEGEDAGCSICRNLITYTGRELPDARYALLTREDNKGFLLFDSLRLCLRETRPEQKDKSALDILSLKDREAFSASPTAGYIPRVTKDDLDRWTAEGRRMPEDEGPLRAGDPKTFGVLACEAQVPADKAFRSPACLAACKADVDNLGLIFGIGLEAGGESRFTISRFAMLSRMLHHFFSSCLIRIIEKEFPDIYVVFAGGDDLFVLGPWSDAVLFARRLHETFSRFAGGNPDVTISAGVALAKAGLPMRGIRDLAEENLEKSKGRTESGTLAKNAVTLFNITCAWEDYPEILRKGEWLEELVLSGGLTAGFVRRLLHYAREARKFNDGHIASGLFRSHMIYDRARNINEKKFTPEDLLELQNLSQDIDRELLEISINWALYRTRTAL